jgi:hypothetical protein
MLAWKPAIITEGFLDFLHSTQTNSGIVPAIGHDRFLLNPSKLFIHVLSHAIVLILPVSLLN